MLFKSNFRLRVINTGVSSSWNDVKTLGNINAIAKTSGFTFFLKVKNCLFAGSVGVALRKKMSIGVELMENFSLNSAKSFLGRNVNLHLKDGAVIINVHLTRIRKGDLGKGKLLEYVPFGNRKVTLIPLRNIAWAELLNLNLLQTAG